MRLMTAVVRSEMHGCTLAQTLFFHGNLQAVVPPHSR
jgi:hypothetical protein